jgi:putative tricarboxylic transport membrane protein
LKQPKLFKKIYDTKEWQDYMTSESLSPLWMNAMRQKAYWKTQNANHIDLLKMLGE